MKAIDLSNVEEAKEFTRPEPGGYICGITSVEDVPEKEYLRIEYDIAEGDYKNFWRSLYESKSFWGGSFIKSYKEKALPFFKAFITAVEKSNRGFKWANDETALKRKLVGLVLGEEEYQANDGTIKTRLYVDQIHSVEKIKAGEFKIPDLKRYTGARASAQPDNSLDVTIDDDGDLPF